MPAKGHLVGSAVWSRTFADLDPVAMVAAFYVWTCRVRASEGLFSLPIGYAAADMGVSPDEAEAALTRLADIGIDFCADHEVALDRWALRINPLRHPRDKDGARKVSDRTGELLIDKRVPHAVRMFAAVPEGCHLRREFIDVAARHAPDLADAIRDDYPDINDDGPGNSDTTRNQTRIQHTPSVGHRGTTDGASEGASKGHPRPIDGASERCKAGTHEGACILDAETADGDGRPVCLNHAPCVHCGDPESDCIDPDGRPAHMTCAAAAVSASPSKE